MFKESIRMSWSNIINNKLRSFLTMLGIVIGVASIIALITIVQGATGTITEEITALGANKLTIQTRGTPLKQGLNEADLARISQIPNVSGVSPTISGNTAVAGRSNVLTGVSIQGKNEVYFQDEAENISAGRGINILDIEAKNQVAVIGSSIVEDLFFGQDPLGEELIINGSTYTVVGFLKPTSGFAFGSPNRSVMIPYTTAMRTLGIRNITSVDVFMADSNQADVIISDIEGVLNEAFNYHDQAFSVFNMQDMLDVMGDVTGIMSMLLAGIASISLVVGGIGIMNMMLVSVTERTTEIGLRKALGAEPSRIQLQFLIESVFLSLFGGIIGMLVGLGIAYIAAVLIDFTFKFTFLTILLAVGFSAAVGIIFGLMPARKASRLNPIDALRHV